MSFDLITDLIQEDTVLSQLESYKLVKYQNFAGRYTFVGKQKYLSLKADLITHLVQS